MGTKAGTMGNNEWNNGNKVRNNRTIGGKWRTMREKGNIRWSNDRNKENSGWNNENNGNKG